MSKPTTYPATIQEFDTQLRVYLVRAKNEIFRVETRASMRTYTPADCAYMDAQLEKAIMALAAARALVIIGGGPPSSPASSAEEGRDSLGK